ncbi:MAG TPA: 2-C-methyl-D-erythritol 4-phosphate cytidylyltransferase [Mycobacterium sp.]
MELSGVVPLPVSVVANPAVAFLPLAAATPLTRLVRTILGAVTEPGRVVVAAAEPLVADVRAILASEELASVSVVAVGGAGSRADCLRAALDCLRRAAFSTSHVLVHDIGRPLASADLVMRVVAGMRDGGAVVMPILAVTDSVKAVDVRGSVIVTVDRSVLRAVQYPRGFTVGALSGLLARGTPGEFDEIAAAVGADVPIAFVDGDPDAFHAELPQDAEFIEAIIASRSSDPGGV